MSMNATESVASASATLRATVDFPLPEPPAMPMMSGFCTRGIYWFCGLLQCRCSRCFALSWRCMQSLWPWGLKWSPPSGSMRIRLAFCARKGERLGREFVEIKLRERLTILLRSDMIEGCLRIGIQVLFENRS